jgi:hypothetical protein
MLDIRGTKVTELGSLTSHPELKVVGYGEA